MKKLLLVFMLTISPFINAQMPDYSDGTSATGSCSVAMGYNTTASGARSTAMGRKSVASGYYSTTIGYDTRASDFTSTVIGQYSFCNWEWYR